MARSSGKRRTPKPGPPRGGKASRVRLEGDLTIGRAPALREELLRALERKGKVVLSFGEVGRVDLCFLQLLCALVRSARQEGREVAFAPGGIPSALAEAASAAGFSRAGGSDPGSLWPGEGKG